MRITDRYGDSVQTTKVDDDGTVYITARDVHDGGVVEVELDNDARKALRKALKRKKS